jgi:hypothetical protein
MATFDVLTFVEKLATALIAARGFRTPAAGRKTRITPNDPIQPDFARP